MEEFAKKVKGANDACAIAEGSDYSLSPKEQKSTAFRRSLFAVKDIAPGDVISEENVRSIRPGYRIAPKYLKEIIGKTATKSIDLGELITCDYLESLK